MIVQNEKIKDWSRGQLEIVNNCPSCGNKHNISSVYERHDNDSYMPDKWHMVKCGECHSIWLNSRPDSISLSRAYDNYYTHTIESDEIPQTRGNRLIWKLIHGYLNYRFKMQKKPALSIGYLIFSLIEPWRLKLDYYGRHLTKDNVGTPGKLLDIGCGNGAFLSRASEMGWEVTGCEIDPKAVAACKSLGHNVIEGDAFHQLLEQETFDVITLSHVIEHLTDPQRLLQRINKLLRPGGYLWIALPNPQSIGLNISKSAWHALHPPFHLNIPSRLILIKWLKAEGFNEIKPLRRGAHVRQVWQLSNKIAVNESIPPISNFSFFFFKLIADCTSTFSTHWAEETVILAKKKEI